MDAEFALLGRTGVRIDGRLERDWGTPKARAMLAVLFTRPNQWTSTDTLLEWMWSEDDDLPENPAQTFYGYASKIKKILEPAGRPEVLEQRFGAYRVAVDDRTSIDYFASRALLNQARALNERDRRRACALIRRALEPWSDEPLADVRGEPAVLWRENARTRTVLPAYTALCGHLLAMGEHAEALALLEELDPPDANLSLVMHRIAALYGLDRTIDADELYLDAYRRLQSDFDVSSAEALRRFHDDLVERRNDALPATAGRQARDAVAPNQLPHGVLDFTGREVLLAKLTATAIAPTGEPRPCVIVLDGQGGVGKTALAVHWARHVVDSFPDGRLYVDLHGFSERPRLEPNTVVDRFLEALGVPADRLVEPERRAARLQALLTDRRVLVVLDNAVDSGHVRPLLDVLSTCVVLVTSRRRLESLAAGYGSYRYGVEPLTDDQAVELLRGRIGERALAEPAAVTALARLSGGLPVLLGPLAQWILARPLARLAEFVEQLRREMRVLDLGDGGDGENHSLKAVLMQSYRVLPPAERVLFRLLGAHPGVDVTVDAAVAIVGSNSRRQVRRGLDILVAHHLLSQPGSLDRYQQHHVVREFAVDRLAEEGADERTAAEDRLLEFYLHSLSRADATLFRFRPGVPVDPLATGITPLDFPDGESAMRWCLEERENITALVRFAAARGLDDIVWRLAQASGELLKRYGHYEDVLANLRLALESARAVRDDGGEADLLHNIGHVHLLRQEYGAAEDHFHHAYRKYLALSDEVGMAVALHSGARVHVDNGDVVIGIESHSRALRMIRATEHKAYEVAFLCRIGEAHRRAFDFDQAAVFYRESLNLAIDIGDLRGQAVALCELSALAYERADTGAARDYAGRSLALAERIGDLGTAGQAGSVLAAVHHDGGRLAEAEDHARRAAELCRRVGDSKGEAGALDRLAQVLRKAGNVDDAVDAWERAYAILADFGSSRAAEIGRELTVLRSLPDVAPAQERRSVAARRTFEGHPVE